MYQDYKNIELVKPAGLDLKDRLVGVQRVTKVTKGGRAFGFSAIVVVGDENGVIGQGLGKSKVTPSNRELKLKVGLKPGEILKINSTSVLPSANTIFSMSSQFASLDNSILVLKSALTPLTLSPTLSVSLNTENSS